MGGMNESEPHISSAGQLAGSEVDREELIDDESEAQSDPPDQEDNAQDEGLSPQQPSDREMEADKEMSSARTLESGCRVNHSSTSIICLMISLCIFLRKSKMHLGC